MGKQVHDLIGDDTRIIWTGTNGKAAGTARKITSWKEFGTKNNSGHFFPVEFDDQYVGESLTVKGRSDGDREVKLDADKLLVIRLENLSANTVQIEKDGEPVVSLDFSGVSRE